MTPIADMVAELLARGVDHEVIVIAVRAAEQARSPVDSPVDKMAENRRAYDRERRRKQRESGGNPPESGGHAESALTLKSLKKEKVSKRTQIPPDWKPSEAAFLKAAEMNIPPAAVEAKAEDMRIWAGSTGAVKKDWDLTFLGFLRRDAPKLAVVSSSDRQNPNLPGYYAAFSSPELEAWNAYEKKIGKSTPRDKAGGWRFPSRWPPDSTAAEIPLRDAGEPQGAFLSRA